MGDDFSFVRCPEEVSSSTEKESFGFSKRGQSLIGQEMFKVLDKARVLEKEGIRVYHLELGNPRLTPPPAIIEDTIAAIQSLKLGYTPSSGLPELRSALASHYSRKSGRDIGVENVVISPANLLISQFLDIACDEGDRVVLFSPAFPSYWAAAANRQVEIFDVPLDSASNYELTEAHIDEAVLARPKAIIVNSANNPTGVVYSRKVLEYLARRCQEASIWLLSDETYADFCHNHSFYSLTALNIPQLVVISSLSKVFSIPGFRVGYAVTHPAVAEKLAVSSSTLISCLPAFTQIGCLAGLCDMETYVEKARSHFLQLVQKCLRIINDSEVLCCVPPQAGFYIFLDISATGLDDIAFSNRLLEERFTAVTPGRSFGSLYKNSIRIAACGSDNDDDILHGVREVVSLAKELIH